MTRDEFTSLPLKIALGVIYDMARARLESMPMPAVPRAPKYDGRLPRKGGFSWMSEHVLDDLQWWLKAKREGAAGGGQYAEQDGKTAAALEKWIAWRELFPNDRWRGKRGEEFVTAEAPSKPAPLRARDPKQNGTGKPPNGAPATQRGGQPPATKSESDDFDY